MIILGISSATKTISCGLIEEEKIIAELTFSGREAFTEDLVVYIKKIIQGSNVFPDAIAVTEGPGSYSGLRGGLATAKTLAQVLKLPVVGVSTLESIAFNLIDCRGTIGALTHARGEEFNFALFTVKDKKLKRLTKDLIINFNDLIRKLDEIRGSITLAGETGKISQKLKEISPKTTIITAANNHPRGTAVAFLGRQLLREKKTINFLDLLPKYSHLPNIRIFKK